MALDQPPESFLFGQGILDTEDRYSALSSGQVQPRIAVDNRAVSRDDDWFSEGEITTCNQG
jgi:hypothetical protein